MLCCPNITETKVHAGSGIKFSASKHTFESANALVEPSAFLHQQAMSADLLAWFAGQWYSP